VKRLEKVRQNSNLNLKKLENLEEFVIKLFKLGAEIFANVVAIVSILHNSHRCNIADEIGFLEESSMKKLVVLSVVGVAAALVTSCNLFKGGEKKDSAAPSSEQQTSSEQTAPQAETSSPATSASNESALANAWQSACTPATAAPATELGMSNSRRTVALTSTGTFEKTENFFAKGCDESAALTYKVNGTYAMLGENPSNTTVKNIDFTVDSASISVSDAATAEKMNAAGFCGISDWKVDTATDITGKDCKGFTVAKGDVLMDVYKIENDNTLYFGRQFNFAATEDTKTRPESVSEAAPYTKS
jgi:hypothetical protein